MEVATEAEMVLVAAEAVLRTKRPYRALPQAFADAVGLEILSAIVHQTPEVYDL